MSSPQRSPLVRRQANRDSADAEDKRPLIADQAVIEPAEQRGDMVLVEANVAAEQREEVESKATAEAAASDDARENSSENQEQANGKPEDQPISDIPPAPRPIPFGPMPGAPPGINTNRPCRFWFRNKCTRGASCWYSHDADFKASYDASHEDAPSDPEDKTCIVCYESKSRWMIQSDCNHYMCAECCANFRHANSTKSAISREHSNILYDFRCPLCRTKIRFFIPSKWQARPEKARKAFLERRKVTPCKYFQNSLELIKEWERTFPDAYWKREEQEKLAAELREHGIEVEDPRMLSIEGRPIRKAGPHPRRPGPFCPRINKCHFSHRHYDNPNEEYVFNNHQERALQLEVWETNKHKVWVKEIRTSFEGKEVWKQIRRLRKMGFDGAAETIASDFEESIHNHGFLSKRLPWFRTEMLLSRNEQYWERRRRRKIQTDKGCWPPSPPEPPRTPDSELDWEFPDADSPEIFRLPLLRPSTPGAEAFPLPLSRPGTPGDESVDGAALAAVLADEDIPLPPSRDPSVHDPLADALADAQNAIVEARYRDREKRQRDISRRFRHVRRLMDMQARGEPLPPGQHIEPVEYRNDSGELVRRYPRQGGRGRGRGGRSRGEGRSREDSLRTEEGNGAPVIERVRTLTPPPPIAEDDIFDSTWGTF